MCRKTLFCMPGTQAIINTSVASKSKRGQADFAVKQNPKSKQYVIFFKARDSEVMERVFREYKEHDLKAKDSVLEKLAGNQEKVMEMAKEAEKTMENGVKKGMEKVNENIERTL